MANADTQIEIRDALADDAHAIASIYNESIAARDSTMDLVPWTADDVIAQLQAQGDRFATLVLAIGERVAGWAGIRAHHDRPGFAVCCETAIYLRRDETGKGYGNRLIEAQLARCQELGYHHIVARVFANNSRSVRFHEKHGFELVGVQREVGQIDGRWIDITILQKVFTDKPPVKN